MQGPFNCSFQAGFADDSDDGTVCRDFDECANGGDGNECNDDAECFNFDGLYNYFCLEGFNGHGFKCNDSDECAESDIDCVDDEQDPFYGVSMCGTYSACSNMAGGYNCTCNDGWSGNGFNCSVVTKCAGESDGHEGDGHEGDGHAETLNDLYKKHRGVIEEHQFLFVPVCHYNDAETETLGPRTPWRLEFKLLN